MAVPTTHALQSCHPCRSKKRQCDRLRPRCSRCARVHQACFYGEYMEAVTIGRQEGLKSPLACLVCKKMRRSCGKEMPQCSRCKRLDLSCEYNVQLAYAPNTQSSTQDLLPIRNRSHTAATINGGSLSYTPPAPWTVLEPSLRHDYPIQGRAGMSTLINHFCSFSFSPISPAVPNSLAVHLHTAWMRHAMVDPCLFHSTLFSASAHIDNLRDSAESPRTTYHSMQTVRLLRQKLDDQNSRGRYEVAGAVLALALFNMRLDRPEIALTHRRGLMDMLDFLKGDGTHLTELVALIQVMLLVFSMIIPPDRECPLSRSYAQTHPAPYPPSLAPRASDLLGSILRRDADANIPATFTVTTRTLIQDIFYHIVADFHGMVHNAQASTTPSHPHLAASSSHAAGNPLLTIEEEPQSNTIARDINLCLQSAASIFRSMLATSQQQHHPISAPAPLATQSTIPNASLVRLRKLLRKVGFPSWLQHAPEAYLWICLTAAASAADLTLRGGFIMMSMPVLLALETTELSVTRQAWVYFMWLEQARGVGGRGPGAGIGVGVVRADGSQSGVSELS